MEPPIDGTCWVLQSAVAPHRREDDSSGFPTRLIGALRAGHGAAVAFRIRLSSGPGGTLTLLSDDPAATRWVQRAFIPAYEQHQWHRSGPPPGHLDALEVWDGRRSRAWPEPLRAVTDGGPAIDSMALALSALPGGAVCEWSFRPLPLGHPAWWEFDPSPPDTSSRGVRTIRRTGAPAIVGPEKSAERPSFWEAGVRLECRSPAGNLRFGERAAGALESATRTQGGNGLRFRRRRWWVGKSGERFPLAEPELVSVLPSPGCPGIGPRENADRAGSTVLPIGRTETGIVVGPLIEPHQGRHLAVLGETGMGKSSLLVALCRKVVPEAGLIVFDPFGDTAHSVRDELPPALAGRVIWIDPGQGTGFNALEGIGCDSPLSGARRERQLNDLVHSFRRVRSGRYVDSGYWGPRLEEMLTRALSAAAAFPGGTLVDAHALLASGGRGFRGVPPAATDSVRELSDRIRSRPEDAEGARRLLYEVTRSEVLVGMLCARNPALRAVDLVSPGRVVLIAGDAGSVGESSARYLLSVVLALVWAELQARPGAPKTFVVLDEAQWFVHESLAEMLRLGRRRNVHVVLATQAIASLPESVAEAAWTNVADFVAFRGSPEEAREFSRVARGVSPESLLALPRGHAAALLGKGNAVHWVRTARIPARPRVSEPRSVASDPAPVLGPGPGSGAGTQFGPGIGPRVPASLVEVLREIDRQVRAAAAISPVRVSLPKLREAVDPGGRLVREVGALLGRYGAIARTGRDASGPCWWIDPERFGAAFSLSRSNSTDTGSEPPQPS